MRKKNTRNTKGRIVSAAWKLFYEQGYEDTTVDDIIYESGTSKGSFYHYFSSKDALLSSLSYLFDEKYEELRETLKGDENAFDTLIYLNRELFMMIEQRIPLDLLARMYSTQLVTSGERHLLDHNRIYYKLLRSIVLEGQKKGELVDNASVNEIVKVYAMSERAILYDWCICNGEYSLSGYAEKIMPMFMSQFKK